MMSVAPSPTEPASAVSSYLGLVAAGEDFCLPVASVREIRAWSAPTALPRHDPSLLGIINLRGAILPVLDLARVLGLSATGLGPRPVIVVIEADGRVAGLAVERVMDMLHLPDDLLEPPPLAGLARGRLAAIALHDDRPLRILEPASLLVLPGGPA